MVEPTHPKSEPKVRATQNKLRLGFLVGGPYCGVGHLQLGISLGQKLERIRIQ